MYIFFFFFAWGFRHFFQSQEELESEERNVTAFLESFKRTVSIKKRKKKEEANLLAVNSILMCSLRIPSVFFFPFKLDLTTFHYCHCLFTMKEITRTQYIKDSGVVENDYQKSEISLLAKVKEAIHVALFRQLEKTLSITKNFKNSSLA